MHTMKGNVSLDFRCNYGKNPAEQSGHGVGAGRRGYCGDLAGAEAVDVRALRGKPKAPETAVDECSPLPPAYRPHIKSWQGS